MASYRPSRSRSSRSILGSWAIGNIVPWILVAIEVGLLIPWAIDIRPDRQVDLILGLPCITEKYSSSGHMALSSTIQAGTCNLVSQAQSLARLINPPIERLDTKQARSSSPIVPPPTVIAQTVRLLGIAYYPARPDKSMALMAIAGLEPVWVRIGSRVGQIELLEVDRGQVVYRDGTSTIRLGIDGSIHSSVLAIERPSGGDDKDAR